MKNNLFKRVLSFMLSICILFNGLNLSAFKALAATALKDGRAETYNSNQYYHIDILVNAEYEYVLTFDKENTDADHADIIITKQWNATESTQLPESITVNVNKVAGGNSALAQTVTLTASNNWAVTLENMPLYDNGQKITYSVSEDDVSAPGFYETIVTEIDNNMESTSEDTMVYTEGDKTITFYYDSTAPHINIDGVAYPYSTANWVDNGDGTYSLTFTYSHNPDPERYSSPLTYTSTWIYDSNTKIYTYISDDYMVVDGIRYATYISTSGTEKVLYDANNYVPGVTSVTRDKNDNEVARNYYEYAEQADAYRDDVHYSQEFWSRNRAIEDMPAQTIIRVGYDYTYGYFDKFGKWHSDTGWAEQVFDTASAEFKNICDKASSGDTQRGFDVVLQLSDAVLYLGDGLKETYNVDITNTPVSELAISKQVTNPDIMPDTAQEFELKITLDNFLGNAISGTFAATIGQTATNVTFVNGVATIKLNHGETIVISGLPKGVGYTVEEINVPEYYTVSYDSNRGFVGANNATVNNTYNPPVTEGNLVIKKIINHTLGTDYTIPEGMSFAITATLTDKNGAPLANQTFNTSASGVTVTTDEYGKFTVNLKNNESVEILDIPAGAVVVVEEKDVPGFTDTYQPADTATITAGETSYVTVLNSYNPSAAEVTIDISGKKILKDVAGNIISIEDERWDNLSFEFIIQKYVFDTESNTWKWVNTETTDIVNKNNGTIIDFASDGRTLTFNEVGTYNYQVIEKYHGQTINGVIYDGVMHTFSVIVTDADMDGELEATVVCTHGENTENCFVNIDGTWTNNTIDFTNILNADEVTETVMIRKSLENPSNSPLASLAGFRFELYKTGVDYTVADGQAPVATTEKTDGAGESYFTLKYKYSEERDTSADAGETQTNTYYYVLKEVNAGQTIGGITYSAQEYKFSVIVTTYNDGRITTEIVWANGQSGVTENGYKEEDGTFDLVTFTNKYTLESTAISIPFTKNLTGKTLENGTFVFNAYRVTSYEGNTAVVDWDNVVATAKNGETLTISGLDTAGTFYYAIKEADTGIPGITYDSTVYYVKVTVADNGDGKLNATYSVLNGTALVFNNTYQATPTSVVLTADKVLTDTTKDKDKVLTTDMFTFTLVEVDENGNTVAGGEYQTVTNTTDDIEVVFAEINYTEEGTYFYRVTETAGTQAGITYDSNEYIYKVVVGTEINGTTASLYTTVTVTGANVKDNRPEFVNTYSASPVQLPVSGTKVFVNGTVEPGMFTFGLYSSDENGTVGDLLYTTTNDATGNFIFEKDAYDGDGNFVITDVLTFAEEGTYYYVVKESVPADREATIIYDSTAYLITVVVTDNGNGKLVATPTITKLGEAQTTNGIVFTNTALVSCSLAISGEKSLTGKNLKEGQFYFALYHATYSAADGWTKGVQHGQSVQNVAGGTFSFPAIEYAVPGTYYYIVEEVTPKADTENMSYDRTQRYITVSVTDSGNGKLKAEIVSVEGNLTSAQDAAKDVIFNNKYTPSSAYATIYGKKTLTGRDWTEKDRFIFDLYETGADYVVADGQAPIDTQTVTSVNETAADGGRLYAFDAIQFTADTVGTKYYVIRERQGNDPTITYSYERNVKITATLNMDTGLIEVTVTTWTDDGMVDMENIYTEKQASATVAVQKEIINNTGVGVTLKGYQIGVYENANCTPGTEIATFATDPTGYATYKFEYTDADFNPVTDNAGEKVFTYYLKEIVPADKLAGMTYDSTVFTYTVTLSYNEHNELVAEAVLTDGENKAVKTAEIVNEYTLGAATATISGNKALVDNTGEDIWNNAVHADKEFVVELYRTDDTMNYATGSLIGEFTVKRTAKGYEFTNSNTDNALTFDKAGTYHFAVREKYSGSDSSSEKYQGVRYDGKEYGVEFVVERGTGADADTLAVADTTFYLNGQEYTGTLDFENIYTITGDTTVEFSGTKALTGRELKENDFMFQLFNANENWTTETIAYRTAHNTAYGTFTFGTVHYDAAGTYRYVIREVSANNPTVTYDKTEYRITVTVSDNGDGTWTNQVETVKVSASGTAQATEKGKASGVVFSNTYTTMPATATVNIDKVLINNTGVEMDESGFVFQLYSDAECTKPVEGLTATSNTHGKAEITLNFTDKDLLAGAEKVYYLKEVPGTKAGMEYSAQVYKVTVTLAFVRNGDTTVLTATPVITEVTTPATNIPTAVATFTNVYKLNPTEISIPVEKVFAGRDTTSSAIFTFRLYASPTRNYADGKEIGKVALKNGERHIFKDIDALKFTQVGTYYFIAVEENGGHTIANVKYDATQYVVKVVVTDDGNGNLAKAVTYGKYISGTEDKAFTDKTVLKFTNTYVTPGNLMLEFNGTKTVKDSKDELKVRAPKEGEFDFLLYEGKLNESTGKVEATDTLLGHVTNDASGKFYFDGISLEKGTHYFVIKEFAGTDPAITYSAEEYRFTVTVTDGTGTGLVADVAVTDKAGNPVTTVSAKVQIEEKDVTLVKVTDIEFTNTYSTPADAYVSINIDKTVVDNANAGMGKAGFEFGLYEDALGTKPVKDKDNNYIVAMSNNNGEAVINMTFTASDLELGTEKVYYLKETKGTVPGMNYSTETYKVVITLSVVNDNGTVKLVATPVITDVLTGIAVAEPHFTNTYSPETKAYGEITGTKELSGREWTAEDTFTILLYATGADHNVATGKLVGKAVVTAENKSFAFTNDSDTLIVPDALKFTAVGMHYFTIVEEKGGTAENGIDYDGKIYGVDFATEIKDGQLVITKTDKHLPSAAVTDIVFENSYHVYGNTSAEITGTKNLTVRNIRANEFSFALYQTDSTYTVAEDAVPFRTVHTTTSGAQTAQFTFGRITYNKAGEYYYAVKEVSFADPTITYDDTVYNVKVTVSDNGKGQWNTPVIEISGEGAIVFNNKYDSQTAPAVIPVTKQLTDETGVNLPLDGFRFGLYKDENCTVKVAEAVSDEKGKAVFELSYKDTDIAEGAINLTETYYIKEIAGNKPGMAYDSAVYKVNVTVQFTRTPDGVKLTATPDITLVSAQALYAVDSEAVFHNTYKLAPAYLDISGRKVMPQRTVLDSDYIFQLYNATVNGDKWTKADLVQETVNSYRTGSGKDGDYDGFTFADVAFSKAGTYHFIITEKAGNQNGVAYDDSQYQLTVKVAPHAEKAELVAEIAEIVKVTAEKPAGTKAETVVFNNEYTVKGTFSIDGIKTIVNRNWTEDDEFVFAIYETGADFRVDKNAAPIATTTSTDGTFTFADIPVENTAAQFTGPTYDGIKHYYVVTEQAGTDATMTYDSTVYRVTVETRDNLDGTLTAGRFENGTFVPGEYLIEKATEETVLFIFKTVKTETAPEIEFVNVYNTQPVQVDINGTKELTGSQTGRQIKAGEFTFQLWSASISNGRWHEDRLIATTANKAAAEGKSLFTFNSGNTDQQLTFTQAGEYLFIVKESAGTNPIVGYDTTEYNVKIDVTVQDNPETADTVELEAKVYLVAAGKSVEITDSLAQAGLMTFANSYNDTAVTVEILKQLIQNGKPAENAEGFTFVIEDENGKVITDKLISDTNGISGYTFGYDEEDIGKTYTYKVYEKAGDMKGMTYDDTVYTVVVKLTVEDGVLVADVNTAADDRDYDSLNLVFTNRYTSEKPYVPDTGDNTGALTWVLIAVITGALLSVIIFLKKKMNKE